MAKRTTAEIAHIVVNVVCFVIVLLLAALCETIHIEPFKRGFFCDDDTIRYPYNEDTVSVGLAFALGFVIPILCILVCEWIKHTSRREDETKLHYYGRFFWTLCVEFGIFLFGGALCQLCVSIIKLTVGRLRPHFIAVCNPDFSIINCSVGYVTNFVCRGSGPQLREARLSFPSGHSSYIGYTMMFTVLYLHVKAERRHCGLVKHVIQFGAAMTAVYVCVSRVADNKHHYSDVLSGLFIGALFGALVKIILATHWKSGSLLKTSSGDVLPLRYKSSETIHTINNA
ncbi:hypothetical protein SNE40_010588 [Patella caerulea]|uniref:Phosphatidic acid phosphatase type 2/haloperoxidase domain-containing protein n=1 Tax=Patella caerulea TaxID=87958 RepID=A0AAN8JUN3_PATCE